MASIGDRSTMVVHQLVELGVAGSNPVGHPRVKLGTPEYEEGSRMTRPSLYISALATSDVAYHEILCLHTLFTTR